MASEFLLVSRIRTTDGSSATRSLKLLPREVHRRPRSASGLQANVEK
jgi:hypothetical protein